MILRLTDFDYDHVDMAVADYDEERIRLTISDRPNHVSTTIVLDVDSQARLLDRLKKSLSRS